MRKHQAEHSESSHSVLYLSLFCARAAMLGFFKIAVFHYKLTEGRNRAMIEVILFEPAGSLCVAI